MLDVRSTAVDAAYPRLPVGSAGSFACARPLLELGPLDHYTIITEDAERACDFHVQVLGFHYLRTQNINTGTVPAGDVDMINHILAVPRMPGVLCVITEGRTEATVFRRYLRRHGEGIHHVAYQVSHLDRTFQTLQRAGVHFTSQDLLRDPLSDLRQVFIGREHTGYFLELIERTGTPSKSESDEVYFVDNNMSSLAQTMEPYLSPCGDKKSE
jgi:catechol 2,3-dioxygenase-like lactoylglutathione lyase family enzyme